MSFPGCPDTLASGTHPGRKWPEQRRNRCRAVPQPSHRTHPRQPRHGETRRPRPRPTGHHRLPNRTGQPKHATSISFAGIGARDIGGRPATSPYLSPSATRKFGLAFVHQDLGLALDMSVADNLGTVRGFHRNGPFVNNRAGPGSPGHGQDVACDRPGDRLVRRGRPALPGPRRTDRCAARLRCPPAV